MMKTDTHPSHFAALQAVRRVARTVLPSVPLGSISVIVRLLLVLMILLSGCTAPQATLENLRVTIEADGKIIPLQVPVGTTSQSALQQAGITLNNLDRVVPPSYTILANNDVVRITRVREVFTIDEKTIPFEQQTVHNESLPEGKPLLVQPGVNGVEQVTYRQLFENDQEVSNEVFKREVLVEPLPEIMMIGVQKSFTPITIPGKLVYLADGNAWLIEGTTRDRRPVVITGDLDGRVFSLSPKADWLLFTRAEKNASSAATSRSENALPPINSLWAVDLTVENAKPINLKVQNVVHFAGWVPGKGLTIMYSTVEPRETAPGWQANNDLILLTFASTGAIVKQEKILETNYSSQYGWWGTSFAWSPDGAFLAYANPQRVGLVDIDRKEWVPLIDLLPFETGSEWAWMPTLGWSPDRRVLFLVTHAEKAGLEKKESSPLFDLSALPLGEQMLVEDEEEAAIFGPLIHLSPQAGMFAYPAPSPKMGEQGYRVAYLKAIIPEQSDSKRYRLAVMDRDGSNNSILFPADDRSGLDPGRIVWSPSAFLNGNYWMAVNYQGNLWLVDSETGDAQPITGDGLMSDFGFDWK